VDNNQISELINLSGNNAITPDELLRKLRSLPFDDIDFAKIDHHRLLRQGLPEAVYAPNKTSEQCAAIVANLLEKSSGPVLLTRANDEQTAIALDRCPGGNVSATTVKGETLNLITWREWPEQDDKVLIVTAGTSDQAVAFECAAALKAYGVAPSHIYDCGVAGIHRLLHHLDELLDADIVIVMAGMEGALASVVGGIVAAPVIAVPTSTGYGSAFEGITALLAMLSSCAAGVSVMGIDNGFGAACATIRILRGTSYNKISRFAP
jgi:hypothetical protein